MSCGKRVLCGLIRLIVLFVLFLILFYCFPLTILIMFKSFITIHVR